MDPGSSPPPPLVDPTRSSLSTGRENRAGDGDSPGSIEVHPQEQKGGFACMDTVWMEREVIRPSKEECIERCEGPIMETHVQLLRSVFL